MSIDSVTVDLNLYLESEDVVIKTPKTTLKFQQNFLKTVNLKKLQQNDQ